MQLIVFTDLDGSLLNSYDYSFDEAKPTLELLRKNAVPLILCTSKTRKEVEQIRCALDIHDPFIVENGGGIYFKATDPFLEIRHAIITGEHFLIQLGQPYGFIRSFIKKNRHQFAMDGFGDWTIDVIQQHTGLNREEASLAQHREFTEPFLLKDIQDLPRLERTAKQSNLKIVKGGRFFHLIGVEQDKGKAVNIVKSMYEQSFQTSVFSIGLGDSANDIPMLASVDIPILIPHPDGTYEPFENPKLVKADYPGSKGWNQSLRKVIDGLSKVN